MIEKYTNEMIKVGELIYSFALIDRHDFLPDGITLEKDTDHTVLLSVIACSVSDSLYKNKLDIGLVAQFALVHDLVEVYSGDVLSFGLTEEEKKNKEYKEKEALEKIKIKFNSVFPWIGKTIEEYESLSSSEARFVKILDRFMPKVRHVLNNGAFFKNNKITKDKTDSFFQNQYQELFEKYNDEFPELFDILKDINKKVIEKSYD